MDLLATSTAQVDSKKSASQLSGAVKKLGGTCVICKALENRLQATEKKTGMYHEPTKQHNRKFMVEILKNKTLSRIYSYLQWVFKGKHFITWPLPINMEIL